MPQLNRLTLPSTAPRQQTENKSLWNKARSIGAADFFTLGYTGRKFEDLLSALLAAGVRTLVDIRQNAVSMYRPELSKSNLRAALEAAGIAYVHDPELGVPRDIRAKAIAAGTRDVIWNWYDEFVAKPYVGQNLHRFLNTAEHPVAMMCAELDPTECHRHRLCVALEQQGLRSFDL
jgi:uncharacterized protein (DUF488 family)